MPYSNAKKASINDAAVTENWYVGLSSTQPNLTGGNITEPVGGGYARQLVAQAGWTAATAASPSVKTNANAIEFPEATADWLAGAALGFAPIFTAASGGTFVGYAVITSTPKGFTAGDVARFAAGALRLELT